MEKIMKNRTIKVDGIKHKNRQKKWKTKKFMI